MQKTEKEYRVFRGFPRALNIAFSESVGDPKCILVMLVPYLASVCFQKIEKCYYSTEVERGHYLKIFKTQTQPDDGQSENQLAIYGNHAKNF